MPHVVEQKNGVGTCTTVPQVLRKQHAGHLTEILQARVTIVGDEAEYVGCRLLEMVWQVDRLVRRPVSQQHPETRA